jgi:homodimeric dihydroxyacetone kinase (EC 2.7.1.29)
VRTAVERISEFGRARLGDKTMLDAMIPFSVVLETRASLGTGLQQAWSAASARADDAATATAHLSPRIGRARPLAEKSIGTPDPGAVSFALAVSAVSRALGRENTP